MGSEDALHNKNWRHFCLTWDGDLGHAHWYLEGVKQHSKTNLTQNEVALAAQGIWVFTNEQDAYGGGFHKIQSFKEAMAQTNVWNFVLPVKAMEGMAYGGTSVEGNMIRWSDIIANYNPDGSFTEMPFHLYLPGKTPIIVDNPGPSTPFTFFHFETVGSERANDDGTSQMQQKSQHKWTFPLSDKILKKIEIGKNITIA